VDDDDTSGDDSYSRSFDSTLEFESTKSNITPVNISATIVGGESSLSQLDYWLTAYFFLLGSECGIFDDWNQQPLSEADFHPRVAANIIQHIHRTINRLHGTSRRPRNTDTQANDQ
jgi:hypothetical protein